MWTTPEKHTMSIETLGNATQNKTTRRAGYKKVYEKTPKETFRIKGALWNAEQKNKKTIARQKKAKEKALKWTSQTGKEPYENHSEKNKVLRNATKNNKTNH